MQDRAGHRAVVTEQVTHLKLDLLIALTRILIGPNWVRYGSLNLSLGPVYGALRFAKPGSPVHSGGQKQGVVSLPG